MLQKSKQGLEALGEDEIKSYRVQYTIDKKDFYITKILNIAEIQMNINGLETIVVMESEIILYGFEEGVWVEAPI